MMLHDGLSEFFKSQIQFLKKLHASQRMKLKGQYYAIKKSKSAKAPKEEE